MENLRAIVLMVASMAGFAVEDMFVKWAAADLPTGQILVMVGAFGTPVFAMMAARQGARVWSRDVWHPAVLGRNLAEVIGTLGFITSITLIPLAMASAILQAAPLAVTCGAALFLGEKVGWRRWSAIAAGFIGVMIVIRPGMDGFQPAALWGVLGVIGLSARDLFTRKIPTRISSPQLAAWAFAAFVPLGAVMAAFTGGAVWPTPTQYGYLLGVLTFGVLAYWALVAATRIGEISVVTPFRYSRLVFALIIGSLVFAEIPDRWTLIGSALIIASGLYTFARERRLKQRTLPMQTGPR
jgi:drug/metabolite transporter (DMT)-like permease